MSHQAVQEVLNRALIDPEFRRRLLLEPAEALEGYELTEEEATALRAIRSEDAERETAGLDERRTKAPAWFFWDT